MTEPTDLNNLAGLSDPTEDTPRVTPKRNPSEDLTGQQRRFLRGLAHHLSALVSVGKEGVTEGVVGAARDALIEHELIKVRVHEGAPVTRKQAAPELASGAGAHLVGQLGRIVILYRRRDQKPDIRLPKRA